MRQPDCNLAASIALDEHHDVVTVSEFDDGIADYCEACLLAVGFREYADHDEFGHTTEASLADVVTKLWGVVVL